MGELKDLEWGRASRAQSNWSAVLPGQDLTGLMVMLQSAKVNVLVTRLMSRIGNDFGGLGCPDISVLMALRLEPDHTARPSELGKLFNVTPAAVTYRVGRLSAMGLVKRLTDRNDKRVAAAKLTVKGVRTIDAIIGELAEKTLAQVKALDDVPGGGGSLVVLMTALVDHWENSGETPAGGQDRPAAARRKRVLGA